MEKPLLNGLVSICFLAYRGEEFVIDALEALLAQDYRPIEIVILDDIQSSAKIKTIAQGYAKKHPDLIRYFLDDTHRITNEALNYVITLAKGEFLMVACDDDLWDPIYVRTLASVLQEHPEVGLVYSNGYYILGTQRIPDSSIVKEKRLLSHRSSRFYSFCYYLIHLNVVPIIFGIGRSQLFQQSPPWSSFDNDNIADSDNLFIIKILSHSKIHGVHQSLFGRRSQHRPVVVDETLERSSWKQWRQWARYVRHQWKFTRKILEVVRLSNFASVQKVGLKGFLFCSFLWHITGRYLIIRIWWNTAPIRLLRKTPFA